MKKNILAAFTAIILAIVPARATTFVKDVMLIGGTYDETASLKTQYQSQGWTVINYDLNKGCGGSSDYIFLLYKGEQGTNGLNRGYVTGFYIKTGASGVNSELTYDGRTYHLAPCDGGSHFKEQKGDLNSNTGENSASIHLYYTKESFTDNRAVSGIVFNDTQSGALGANGGTSGYDLNAGCGSDSDYIYMHVVTATALPPVVINGNVGEVTLQDGDILTGTGGNGTHIYIADDATVTLCGVSINDVADTTWWPCIECLGDATIVLADENTVTSRRCAIEIPEGKTLTIRGDGSLVASSTSGPGIGGNVSGPCGSIVIESGNITAYGGTSTWGATSGAMGGPGIGCGSSYTASCGDITISGGVVNARGGFYASGIGCGTDAHCGDITISGGTVTAIGGYCAAGIGSGEEGGCGDITITTGATVVTATAGGGDNVQNSIGAGWRGTCGTVTIGGIVTGSIDISPYTYRPSETAVFTATFNANGGSGTMASQSFFSNIPQTLNGNAFTRASYNYAGWNTAADGSGTGYGDRQMFVNAGNLTLYAQWTPISYRISYDLAGGRWGLHEGPFTYNVETDTFTLCTPYRTGFTFAGWTWDGQSTPVKTVTIAKGSTGDRSFTANWSNAEPRSNLEACLGNACTIIVAGWAYDPDTPKNSIRVQVKVFLNDGTTLFREATPTADIPRSDVNDAFGITGQHGFAATFYDIPAGTYKVMVYAIDSSGQGNNPQIGLTQTVVVPPKTVGMTGGTGAVTLFDGDVLTGTGGADTHVLIADGATVTLSGATVTAISRDDNHKWAGLTCLGDATIVLADGTASAMKGGKATYPGIYVPAGKTLTIRGTGSLDADGNNNLNYGAAGIGGGYDEANGTGIACGNIVIAGGNVTAHGGLFSAGIGGGYKGACGSVTVCGGTVAAYGGWRACAIGPGANGSCGDIAITEGVVTVTAVVDDSTANSHIGGSTSSTCGTITIHEGLGERFRDPDHRVLVLCPALVLSDGADNAAAIAGKKGRLCLVTLQGRTLHRYDGYWNALCLPFDMTAEQISEQIQDLYRLMTLDSATLIDGTLTLNFTQVHAIEAGKPYLARWLTWSGGTDWTDPAFADVTVPAAYTGAAAISNALSTASRTTDIVDFVGNFSPVVLAAGDQTALCLGDANTFVQPGTATSVNSCRAYFRLKGGLRAGREVKRCVLNLGGGTITGVFLSPYELWSAANGVAGAWNETDAFGVHNVFRYAFGKPTGAFANPPLLGIEFDAAGNVVIVTPSLVNTDGFTFSVVASDNVGGTGNVAETSLSASGKTTINETGKSARFFRLRATEQR